MSTLYVTEQNAWIRKTSDRLVIEKDGALLAEVPCLKLETVFLYGNVQFTTQALAELLDHGIEVALFTMSGRLRGQVTPPKAKNVVLRMKQYERMGDSQFRLSFAKEVVQAKIESSVAVLRRFRANHPEALSGEQVEEIVEVLPRVGGAESSASLLGIEGTAAARYFPLLCAMIPEPLRPARRARRPPPDPFNSLLSFGYVLVGNELQSLLDGMGFDPYLGLYHEVAYGRASLALDLLEEFRPALVDRFAATLLNRHQLTREDFTRGPEGGVVLQREALKRFFVAWEAELAAPMDVEGEALGFRQVFRRQAERLARAMRGEEEYRSFRLPC